VAGPFHSSLLKAAAGEFEIFLRDYTFNAPRIAFIDNVSGGIEKDPDRIREKLVLQLYSPVQWERSVLTARDSGAALFIESGPGSVLSGLVKRIARDRKIAQGEKLLNPS
jgi:[acyl-carrier-protein] S-malonyltransferase